jgi:hypothetical protein
MNDHLQTWGRVCRRHPGKCNNMVRKSFIFSVLGIIILSMLSYWYVPGLEYYVDRGLGRGTDHLWSEELKYTLARYRSLNEDEVVELLNQASPEPDWSGLSSFENLIRHGDEPLVLDYLNQYAMSDDITERIKGNFVLLNLKNNPEARIDELNHILITGGLDDDKLYLLENVHPAYGSEDFEIQYNALQNQFFIGELYLGRIDFAHNEIGKEKFVELLGSAPPFARSIIERIIKSYD